MIERLLRRWEGLRTGVQVAVAFPLSVAFMLVLHLGPLRQPLGRGLGYAVFWGVLMTGAIIAASKAERAKRRDADRDRRGGNSR